MLTGKRRIMVVGPGGAGKSTFARQLGEFTGLPVIHLDREHWGPGWTPTPKEIWTARVADLVTRPTWIIDGNYGGTLGLRVARRDAIVFLDFPRWRCFVGIVRRRFTFGGEARPDTGPECPERLDLAFLRWVWSFPKASRHRVVDAIAGAPPGTETIVVRGPSGIRRVLASLPAARPTDATDEQSRG